MADGILGQVEEENQDAAASVRNLMFTFEDILTIDKTGMKACLDHLDRKVLKMALKGTAPKIREHFTQCMSQRSTEMLVEDMEALGPVRIRDVQAAQNEVVAVVRQLQQNGTLRTAATAATNMLSKVLRDAVEVEPGCLAPLGGIGGLPVAKPGCGRGER